MNEIKQIINEALGETSAVFMTQGDTKAGEIIMPTEELIRISYDTVKRIKHSLRDTLQKIKVDESKFNPQLLGTKEHDAQLIDIGINQAVKKIADEFSL